MTDIENVFLTKERKKYFLVIAGLIFLNILSFTLFNKREGYDSGNYISNAPFENFKWGTIIFLVVLPVLSLFLATLIALFPNKNFNYGQRLKRVLLFVWLIANLLMTGMHIVLSFEAYKTPEPECDCMPKTIQDSIAAVEAQTVAEALIKMQKDTSKMETSLNTAVFTTKNVMRKDYLITRVYHDDDNSWQFFDDLSTNSNKNIMVVSLKNILEKDSSVKEVLNIPMDTYAVRKSKDGKWTIMKSPKE